MKGGNAMTGPALRKRANHERHHSARDVLPNGPGPHIHDDDPWNAAVVHGRKLDLGEYPSSLLLRAANVIHLEGTAVYARKHGLSLPEWRILGRLCESAPMPLAALCRISHFDKAQATRVLRSLAARRLVRMLADPSHRNRRIVDLTPGGRKLAQSIFPEALEAQMKLLKALSPDERRATFSALKKLLAVYGAGIPAPASMDEGRSS
ncbi:MarR family winged helix-turn-helix transcriptional regulator [Pseudorhodoplanes sp.]|uniref:MarR family winged helix-turn-helix transcriptional regulator n=1 Tax=Pseudorhodoplanes sp. TaxID=1934341 RepID=UPI003D0BE330